MDEWAKRLDEKDKHFQATIDEKDKVFQAFIAHRDTRFIDTVKERDDMWQKFLADQRDQQYAATARFGEELKRLNESMAVHFALLQQHDSSVVDFRRELASGLNHIEEMFKGKS